MSKVAPRTNKLIKDVIQYGVYTFLEEIQSIRSFASYSTATNLFITFKRTNNLKSISRYRKFPHLQARWLSATSTTIPQPQSTATCRSRQCSTKAHCETTF